MRCGTFFECGYQRWCVLVVEYFCKFSKKFEMIETEEYQGKKFEMAFTR
jgi:hypothetical protein